MRVAALGVLTLSLLACERDKTKGAPASTQAQDALWALAPAGTELGLVATPRAFGLIDAATSRALRTVHSLPDQGELAKKLDDVLMDLFGTTQFDVASRGLTVEKGFAFFAPPGGKVAILPVIDRAKFIASVVGTTGTDTDTFSDFTCKTVQGVYACAKPATLLDGLGKNGLADAMKLVGARGDVELAGAAPGPQGPIKFAGAAQLERGSFVLRAAVSGIGSLMPMKFAKAIRPRLDGDHTTGFGVMDFTAILSGVPPFPLVPGVNADEVARSVTGPVTMTVSAGDNAFDIRAPLGDPGPMQKFLAACDQFAPLQKLGATTKDGVCHFNVPQMLIELDAWTQGNELRLGKKGMAASTVSVPMTAIGKELAAGEWPMAFYGRGTIFATPVLPQMPGPLPANAEMILRAFSMVDELSFATRMDGDTMRFVVSLRTAWENSDDLIAKLQALPASDVLLGKSYPAAKAIADGAQGTSFAADFKAGYGGLMVPAAAVGMMAAVAIPAFMEYMERSKAAAHSREP